MRTGHAIDLFVCALDQCGLLEMRSLFEKTGGFIVMHDTFEKQVFKESFLKMFSRDPTGQSFKLGFKGKIELFLTKDVKVCGCIGPCQSEKKGGSQASETEIGESQTTVWFMAALDNSTTFAFYLDVSSQPSLPPGRQAYLQFQCVY